MMPTDTPPDSTKSQYPLIRVPTVPVGLTLFVLLVLIGTTMGIVWGAMAGHHWFGRVGAIAGAIVGGCLGFFIGSLPDYLLKEHMFKSMQKKSNAELRAVVDEKEWTFIQTLALMNLHLRGEEVQTYLPRVIALLESDNSRTRLFGRDALRWVFTELAVQIDDYDPFASTEECRRKVAVLRARE